MIAPKGARGIRRSELHCRRNRQSKKFLGCTGRASASMHREPTRHGYSYVDVRMAEVGPTHRASRWAASRKTSRARGRWPRRVPFDVLTHAAATPRRERCASRATQSNHDSEHGEDAGEEPVDRDTTEGASIVFPVEPQGAAGRQSRLPGWTQGERRKTSVRPATRRSWNRRVVPGWRQVGRQRSERVRWRLLQPMRRGRSVTRSAARRWLSNLLGTRALRWSESEAAGRGNLERNDRSWPVRIARPSWPHARTARTEPGRTTGHSRRTECCAARIPVHTSGMRSAATGPRVRS